MIRHLESWHTEWMRIADRNWQRGLRKRAKAISARRNCFLRARTIIAG